MAEVVTRSWHRSRAGIPRREAAGPRVIWPAGEAARRLDLDPHGRLLIWTIERLLESVATEHDLAVVVADGAGRILRVSGAGPGLEGAAAQGLRPGADWSEHQMGTNAIGTAALTAAPVWVQGEQHYWISGQGLESWAVPVRCPKSGDVHSVIALCAADSGRQLRRRAGLELALLSATASVVEARLAHRDLVTATRTEGELQVLGRREAALTTEYAQVTLSARHSEITLLLAWHRQGISADRLGRLLYDDVPRAAVVRAEMRRLRDYLDRGIGPALTSRPYAFIEVPHLDVHDALARLEQGDLHGALARYRAPVLPDSVAPGVFAIREEVHCEVRGQVLAHAPPALLLQFARRPENAYDVELWLRCAEQWPVGSPQRREAMAKCQWIEDELAV